MIAGSIEIQLMAGIARLQQDMDKARSVVSNATNAMGKAASVAGIALGAIAGALSISAFSGWIRGAIDAADAAGKLSQKTGIAVKDLAGIQLAYQQAGLGSQAMETSMSRLSKGIVEGSKTLDALGIKSKNLDGTFKSNRDVLYSVADGFSGLQNGAQKTALAIELFGKSGADMIPLLNAGSEGLREMDEMARKLGLTMSEKAAADAEKFNDTIDLLQMGSQGVARGIAAELLPTLNSLAGSFLTSMTEGDKLAKTASFLGATMKILYSVGFGVVEIFSTMGKVIGGVMAGITTVLGGYANVLGRLIKGDFTGAFEAVKAAVRDSGAVALAVGADVMSGWKSTASTIASAWDGSGAAAVEAMGKINKATVLATDNTKALAKAAKDAEAAWLKEQKAIADAAAAVIKVQAEYGAKLAQTVAEANREAVANEELVRTYGMSKAAIEAENIARMEAQVERMRGIDMADDEIAAMEMVIAAKKRSAAALGNIEQLDQVKRINDQIEADYKDTAKSIRDSLTDALMRGFESGKSFGRNLIDTLKNMFKTLVLQPTIQGILAPVAGALTGALGVAGTAQAATGGGGGGVGTTFSGLGMLGSLTSGVGLLGAGGLGLQAGFGALMSGGLAGVSAAVSGGIAAIGAGTGASIAAGMDTIAGALGPIALGIGGAVMLLNKAFGRGPKEMTGNSTLTGSLGAAGFAGSLQDEWKKKGGWFSSSKTGFDTRTVDGAVADGLGQAYQSIQSASADYARALGINADSIASRTQSINIAMSKDEAANQKAIADFFIGVADTVAGELLPGIAKLQKEGEGASATLQRLATNYAAIDAALTAIGVTFGAVGVDSLAARERLVELSGGIEALTANAAGFAQNFLTEAERIAPVAEAVKNAMADLGFSMVDTRDEFKELVLGLDLTTEEGAKTYASLMKIQGAFALANPAIEAIADVVIDFAEVARAAAQVAKDAAAGLLGNVDSSMAVLQRVVNAEKSRLSEAHAVTMKALQQRIDTETAGIAKHKALSDAIASTLGQMAVQGGEEFARSAAQAQITAALAMARAGALPSAESLKGPLSVLSKDASEMFATRQDYERDFYRTQNELTELGKLSDIALSVEEKALATLIAQKDSTQAAFDAEIARLDAVVESAQKQIDLLNGIDTSGITIIQALEAVRLAILSAQQNPVVAATTTINSAYQSSLGRAPDAAGMDYWKNQAAAGMSSEQIAAMINGSAEAKAQALFQSVLGRAGDAGGIAYWTSALSGGMSEQAARALMMQSDEFKKMPSFAAGGDHSGGFRIVGENGPELESTGPSRIFNARQTSQMLGADNSEMVAELRALRAEVQDQREALNQTASASKRLADGMQVVTDGFNAMRTKEEVIV